METVFDARFHLCYSSVDAGGSCDSVYSRTGDVSHAGSSAGGFLYSVERAQPGGLQKRLLRKHDLLRCLGEKHGPRIATAHAKWCGQTASAGTCCKCTHQLQPCIRSGANCLRKRAGPRACASSSGAELHPAHLIRER